MKIERALSEKHIPFEFHVFPFGVHGLATCDEQTNDGEITAPIAHNQRWIEESQAERVLSITGACFEFFDRLF